MANSKKDANAKMDDRAKALDLTRSQIEKQFGKGSIMLLGENKIYDEIEAISTGSLNLDIALGLGGLPKGRVVEIYGPEGSGKTTVCLSVIANCQKNGGTAAFIDAEHAMDPLYARKIGVDIDNLLVSQPDTGEQALEITEMLVRSGAVDIIVIDSVAALVPRAEIEGEMGDSTCRTAGPPHEPGPAQADRDHLQDQHPGHVHQPDPHEDRCHVRQPRDHQRWQRSQVL